jgi:hypothetical protein
MQFVDNGMFALSMNHPIDVDSDNNDDEVLGATSAEGMPLMREEKTLSPGSQTGENINEEKDDPVDIDVEDVEEDCIDVDDDEERVGFDRPIDAFGNAIAPEGYCYVGKLVFICFGPTSKYFAGTLAMGGQSDRTAEEKKQGSRKEQRKVTTDRNNMDREVGLDRGLNMQSKMQCALMAQNEDDADQRHRDMRMLMLSKQIESTERLVELKLKTSERMILGGSEAQVNFTIQLLMEKLERFSGELETMMQEKRKTNPIVGNVLTMAAKAMGLAKVDDDVDDDDVNIDENSGDFVSDMLK